MDDTKSETEVKRVLSGFAPVWQRVTGAASPQKAPSERGEAVNLRRFIRRESQAAACDRRLYGAFRGAGFLGAHAKNAEMRARRLAAELFILTGERTTIRDACPPVRDKLIALKNAMERDAAAAEEYRRQISQTSDPQLRALYRSYADERNAAAARKRALIQRMFY